MPDTIRDGKGRGWLAAVNSEQQLITRATAVEQRLASATDANYYEASSDQITLTDAVETGIIYLKNENAGKVIVIDRVFFDFWTSTGGSGADGTLLYYRNPTITGGTTVEPTNCNFSSEVVAQGTFLHTLTTLTGTHWWDAYITDKTSLALDEGRIVLHDGNSFAISVAAPTGNTSMIVNINVAFYYLDTSLIE